jgi:hypothetical protein
MLHRHLNHEQFTLATIDDIISRGKKKDWAELRLAVIADSNLRDKVIRVCRVYADDSYAQRYHFWRLYAQRYLA